MIRKWLADRRARKLEKIKAKNQYIYDLGYNHAIYLIQSRVAGLAEARYYLFMRWNFSSNYWNHYNAGFSAAISKVSGDGV